MVKMVSFLVGMIMVSLIVAIIGLFIADIGTEYGQTYDSDYYNKYNQLATLQQNAKNIKEKSVTMGEPPGALDVISSMFSQGYQVLLIAKNSFNVADNMTGDAVGDLPLGESGYYFKVAIGSILVIVIFLGIIVAAVLGRDP